MIEVKDRVPTYAGRIKLTVVDEANGIYDMSRADEPSVVGTPLNATLFNSIAADLKALYEALANALPMAGTAEVGQHLMVSDVDDNGRVTEIQAFTSPVSVKDGYTDISGLRQPVSIRAVRNGNTITMTSALQGSVSNTDTITLDDNGLPEKINSNGVEVSVSWEGFDE